MKLMTPTAHSIQGISPRAAERLAQTLKTQAEIKEQNEMLAAWDEIEPYLAFRCELADFFAPVNAMFG